jgi:hypothetical protein
VTNSKILPDLSEKLSALKADLQSASDATQLKAIVQLESSSEAFSEEAIALLTEYLLERQIRHGQAISNQCPTYLDGRAYQVIWAICQDRDRLSLINQQLKIDSSQGVLTLSRSLKLDLSPLQALLAQQQFEKADQLTSKMMCQLASNDAATRGWIYFSEIQAIAILDLQAIDQLWSIYSEAKFGFMVQRRLWLSLGKKWEDFWLQIGWKKDGSFTRYPGGFSWNLKAPKGHLPLSNQIRGNKTIEAIFNHPAWK